MDTAANNNLGFTVKTAALGAPMGSVAGMDTEGLAGLRLEFAEDLVSTAEKRMLWQRYGL